MEQLKQLENDLGYVREVVQRSEHDRSPAGVYLLWAAIVLVGFALVDFAPTRVGFFWVVAGPLGGLTSGILGWRHSVRRGQVRREFAASDPLHQRRHKRIVRRVQFQLRFSWRRRQHRANRREGLDRPCRLSDQEWLSLFQQGQRVLEGHAGLQIS